MTNDIKISRSLAERLTRYYPAEITDQETMQAMRIEALAALDELRALLAAPAVERQEECKCSSGMAIVPWLHSSYCPVFKSLDMGSPHAPVSVVLPERRAVSEQSREQAMCANIWNACLDKVKEMNQREIEP